jgi:hypothetical protein
MPINKTIEALALDIENGNDITTLKLSKAILENIVAFYDEIYVVLLAN